MEFLKETDCNKGAEEYIGQVLVAKMDCIKEEFQTEDNQFWFALKGNGCYPWASATSDTIEAVCLKTGESAIFSRGDFLGVAKEKVLPDWAKDKKNFLVAQRNIQVESFFSEEESDGVTEHEPKGQF